MSSACQPVFSPLHCPLFFPPLPKLHYIDVVGDVVKSLVEVQANNILCSPLIYLASDDIKESHQVD